MNYPLCKEGISKILLFNFAKKKHKNKSEINEINFGGLDGNETGEE